MESVSQTAQQGSIVIPERTPTVVMGRQGFFNILLRLIGVELYKLRRRLMSKIMIIIAIVAIFLIFQVIALPAIYFVTGGNHATQLDLLRLSEPLRLPASFTIPVFLISGYIGLILITILAGTIVGGEYSVGTIRLVLTRGPSRTQLLLAKLGTLLTIITVGILVLTLLGMILGALFNLVTGIGFDLHFLNGEWFIHALWFLLAAIMGLFVYAALAVCLATLGKNTAAGVAGGLVWWVLEGILSSVFSALASLNTGPVSDFLNSVPNYFIGNNIDNLLANQNRYLAEGHPGMLPDLHSVLVLVIYLILFIGLTWWVSEQRDVTN
jgi:ABC-type transport system involved in multi-copper enzyme maturation permease subunit